MAIPLATVLCLMAAVPAVICLAQGKDGPTKVWCAGLLVLVTIIGLYPYVPMVRDLMNKAHVYQISATASAVIALVCGIRIADGIFATLMLSGTVLLALITWGVVNA